MDDSKTLYLLRQPLTDPSQSLLPSAEEMPVAETASLVLIERAVGTTPAFPGQVYVLSPEMGTSAHEASQKVISYQQLVTLIAEHKRIIVL